MSYGLGAAPKNIPYGHDVGQDSDNAILAFAKTSGLAVSPTAIAYDKQPPHADDGGYHSTHNAVDFSGSLTVMDQFAAWCVKFAPYILELIHSSNSAPGGGYFVHDGQVVGSSVYSSVLSGHYDHVHLAMTPSGVAAASGGGSIVAAAADTILNPLDPGGILSGIGDVIKQGANFFKLATNPYTYKRVAYALAAIVFLALGLGIIFGSRGASKAADALGIPTPKTMKRGVASKVRQAKTKSKSTTPAKAVASKPKAKAVTAPKPAETFSHPNADTKLGQPERVATPVAPKKPPVQMEYKGLRTMDYPDVYKESFK